MLQGEGSSISDLRGKGREMEGERGTGERKHLQVRTLGRGDQWGRRGRSLCPAKVQSPTSLPPKTLSKLLRKERNNPSVVRGKGSGASPLGRYLEEGTSLNRDGTYGMWNLNPKMEYEGEALRALKKEVGDSPWINTRNQQKRRRRLRSQSWGA